MRQRSRILSFTLATLLIVVGCSGAPAPSSPSPSSPPSPSVSESSPPTAPEPSSSTDAVPPPAPLPFPEYPDALTAEDTAENAILAAQYFIELINYMQSTGDTEQFEEVSLPSCNFCERSASRYRERKSAGGVLVGGEISVDGLQSERTIDQLAWEVTGDWFIDAALLTSETGAAEQIIDEEILKNHRMGVQLVESRWMLLEVAKEQG